MTERPKVPDSKGADALHDAAENSHAAEKTAGEKAAEQGRTAPDGSAWQSRGNLSEPAIDIATLARFVACAEAIDGLLSEGLTDEARPLAASLRDALSSALKAARGDGAGVVNLDTARRRRER